MVLYFEITEGPNKGQRYKISHGVRIGRGNGEIVLKDPKVSALHAQVEQDYHGKFFLFDKRSSNGIKINGLQVKRVALTEGVVVQLGKTFLTVVQPQSQANVPIPEPPNRLESLKQALTRIPLFNSENSASILPFSPALKLSFLEGCQADKVVILGYGPRQAGSDVLDIDLQEETAPPVAFEIVPSPQGPLFSTAYSQLIRVNEESVSSQVLNAGDFIRIGKTLIRVDFV